MPSKTNSKRLSLSKEPIHIFYGRRGNFLCLPTRHIRPKQWAEVFPEGLKLQNSEDDLVVWLDPDIYDFVDINYKNKYQNKDGMVYFQTTSVFEPVWGKPDKYLALPRGHIVTNSKGKQIYVTDRQGPVLFSGPDGNYIALPAGVRKRNQQIRLIDVHTCELLTPQSSGPPMVQILSFERMKFYRYHMQTEDKYDSSKVYFRARDGYPLEGPDYGNSIPREYLMPITWGVMYHTTDGRAIYKAEPNKDCFKYKAGDGHKILDSKGRELTPAYDYDCAVSRRHQLPRSMAKQFDDHGPHDSSVISRRDLVAHIDKKYEKEFTRSRKSSLHGSMEGMMSEEPVVDLENLSHKTPGRLRRLSLAAKTRVSNKSQATGVG